MKKTVYGQKARDYFLEAARQLAEPVKITLGPNGKNVMISEQGEMAYTTKDGVTVARSIESADPFVNAAIQVIRQASMKTVDDAGDGTTTATILCEDLLEEINWHLSKGATAVNLKHQLQQELKQCVADIKHNAIPIKTAALFDINKVQQVATISANNDEFIGDLFKQAYDTIGPNGTVMWEESKKTESYVEAYPGMKIDHGWASSLFSNGQKNNKDICEYMDPYIFVTDKNITQTKDIAKIVTYAFDAKKPLIIFCGNIEGQALASLNLNRRNIQLPVCAVTIPNYTKGYVDVLKDIAIYTGASFFSENEGKNIDNITPSDIESILGSADFLNATAKDALILGGHGDTNLIDQRITQINTLVKPENGPWEKEFLQARISKLQGGIAYIYAGGTTEVERRETLDRIEDAVLAVRSAIEEGYLPGGGRVYYLLSGGPLEILKKPLQSIFLQLCENSGYNSDFVLKQIKEKGEGKMNIGLNAKTGEIEDLCIAGVVDSAKVARVALENAVSIALAFLNTDCIVAYHKD